MSWNDSLSWLMIKGRFSLGVTASYWLMFWRLEIILHLHEIKGARAISYGISGDALLQLVGTTLAYGH